MIDSARTFASKWY